MVRRVWEMYTLGVSHNILKADNVADMPAMGNLNGSDRLLDLNLEGKARSQVGVTQLTRWCRSVVIHFGPVCPRQPAAGDSVLRAANTEHRDAQRTLTGPACRQDPLRRLLLARQGRGHPLHGRPDAPPPPQHIRPLTLEGQVLFSCSVVTTANTMLPAPRVTLNTLCP